MYYTNDDSMFRREQAKDLYLFSDKTQKQIGETVGVSDRTVREWIKRFRWNELKYRINHPPATFTEGIRMELTNLQNHILAKDCGFPNKEEVNTMHRLILCLQKLTILPQHDHSIISNPALASEKPAEPLEVVIPDSPKTDSSAFVDNSKTILPPLTENQSISEMPLEEKADGRTEKTEETGSTTNIPTIRDGSKEEQNECPPLEGAGGGTSITTPVIIPTNSGQKTEELKTKNILLPNGLTWLGFGRVLDPVTGKPREIKIGEVDQLLQMGFNMRSLEP